MKKRKREEKEEEMWTHIVKKLCCAVAIKSMFLKGFLEGQRPPLACFHLQPPANFLEFRKFYSRISGFQSPS